MFISLNIIYIFIIKIHILFLMQKTSKFIA
jgi:hypothetical protein